ncbi:transcription initiation factor IID, 18kD subunit domain-containing protein [Sarocladium implicatum]|nr:transcription initiation factor IID, 18kD subunit domain-containing protein [Sarocladium implicatum]
MEPRARAGKNVGKMNFTHSELAQLLFAHGDVRNPMPETVRVLDEIITDFMQSIAFEATRAANYSGRQKIKYEDFEFAFRKNPNFLGKVQEVFEKQKEIKKARELLKDGGEDEIMKENAEDEGGKKTAEKPSGKASRGEEELGEGDDDAQADADIGKKK